ncbi:hypothetical protein SPPR111872_05555 [Sphingobacterium prati]
MGGSKLCYESSQEYRISMGKVVGWSVAGLRIALIIPFGRELLSS